MSRVLGMVLMLILLAFALPVLLATVEHLIVPLIIFTALTGFGMFIWHGWRRW
jgi:hypothetical protein